MLIFDRDRQADLLSELEPALSACDVPQYEPVSEKAAEFHRRSEKIRVLLGGNQSGKTHSSTYELINFCRTHPGAVAWACTVSYNVIGEALWPKYQQLLAPAEISRIAWLSFARNIPSIVWLKNGSHIAFKSYDQGRLRFQAARVDLIQLDEEPPYDVYMECLARTSATNGRIIFSLTPLMGKTYVYHDLYLKAPSSPHIWCETMSYLENRFIPDDQKQALLQLYGTDEIDRRIHGMFTDLAGAVWKEFDSHLNIIPRFPIPQTWRRIRSIDFGYSNPFACLWGAMNDDNEIVIYQEYYQSETLLQDHVDAIHARDALFLAEPDTPHQVRGFENTVADHDAQDRAELVRYGIDTMPADKNVLEGIQIVNRYWKQKPNGRPSLFVFDDLDVTLQETLNYRYKPGTEQPIKENDHTQDALRYLVMYFAKCMSRPPVVLESKRRPLPTPTTVLPGRFVSPPAKFRSGRR